MIVAVDVFDTCVYLIWVLAVSGFQDDPESFCAVEVECAVQQAGSGTSVQQVPASILYFQSKFLSYYHIL